MGTTVRIASATLDAIVTDAWRSAAEVCGLLFGGGAHIERQQACRNVAADPATAFEIDPPALLAAHRAMRHGGPRLIGCYHSHPSGMPDPSVHDADAAAPDGWLWLIVAEDHVGLWRAVPHGRLHGRFDPVTMERV